MVGFTVKIKKDFDARKFKDLVARAKLASQKIDVGYPEGDKERDGTSLAMLAAAHTFGVPENGLPERPFMSQGINNNRQQFIDLNRGNVVAILSGKMTAETALGQLGVMAVGAIQQEIKKGGFAPLKEATIKRKKSSKPLISTGQMLQSLKYVLIPKT